MLEPAPTPLAASHPDIERRLLAGLRRACLEGRVAIEIDDRHLRHIHSPVASEAEANLALYPGVVLAMLAGWSLGLWYGLAVAGLGLLAYLTAGRAWIRQRLRRRILDQVLADLPLWRRLWRFGGIRLVPAPGSGLLPCAAPDGRWHRLAAALEPPDNA